MSEPLKFWKCPRCHGTGKIIGGRIGSARIEPCGRCDGTGNALVDGVARAYEREIAKVEALGAAACSPKAGA
jgi:hypothetical protein